MNTIALTLPKRVLIGEGVLKQLAEEMKGFSKKGMIITGGNSVKRSGTLNRVLEELAAFDCLVYDQVSCEPTTEMADMARKAAREFGAGFVIGLGGGSAMDVAKTTAGLYGLDESTQACMDLKTFDKKNIPFIGIPTTAGTGSEITLNAVLYSKTTKNKQSIAASWFQAEVALIDSELTISMPAALTAATGMDALTHAIESYTSTVANEVTKAIALEAIEAIGKGLIPACENGEDREARLLMAKGSALAALAFSQTGVGIAHAISHPLGAEFHISHGVANAILLPEAIRFNRVVCEGDYKQIAKALGMEDAEVGIRKWLSLLPIPKTLSQAGYERGHEESILEKTFLSRSLKKNPRQASREDVLMLIEWCEGR
ncbi:alcohol dehydrogenase EutG [Gottschalkiaceae bacterium SANA]|nr:alcohol dehydrogenase EutG [Gottschalkiaceae bacterium SANA]